MLAVSLTGEMWEWNPEEMGEIDSSDAYRESVTHSQIRCLSEAKSQRDTVLGHRHGWSLDEFEV